MTSRFMPASVQSGIRSILRPIGEFIHVSAIYLGLAMLTTLVLSFVLPSMRQQSAQLHELVLNMFESYETDYTAADSSPGSDWSLPPGLVREPNATTAETPEQLLSAEASEHDIEIQDDLPSGPGRISFSGTLSASIKGQPINGISATQAKALRGYLSRKYKIAGSVAEAIMRTSLVIGHDLGLDPQLILSVIAIESRYNPFAESSVGAQGLMQIMTSVHADKLRSSGGPVSVFNPVVNIRVGGQILQDCIKRRGSVQGGLACYVGATGPNDSGYGAKVLAERRRIALASGIPLQND